MDGKRDVKDDQSSICSFNSPTSGIRALATMAGQRRKPNVDLPSSHQRDLRDIELDELRGQVQQLQQRLGRAKAPEHEVYDHVSEHDLSEDGEDVNPFHRTSISSADSPPRHYRKDRDFGCKIEIPDFEGKHDIDEFID
ncbi:hypothetical protein ACH5RR_040573 [Cinchona calisaya]|uniref:Uncharacterized protein n=1 Tax=Cinchona calisaya TaxID=153742 RepID=A0ABD2XS11_9GENT